MEMQLVRRVIAGLILSGFVFILSGCVAGVGRHCRGPGATLRVDDRREAHLPERRGRGAEALRPQAGPSLSLGAYSIFPDFAPSLSEKKRRPIEKDPTSYSIRHTPAAITFNTGARDHTTVPLTFRSKVPQHRGCRQQWRST